MVLLLWVGKKGRGGGVAQPGINAISYLGHVRFICSLSLCAFVKRAAALELDKKRVFDSGCGYIME